MEEFFSGVWVKKKRQIKNLIRRQERSKQEKKR